MSFGTGNILCIWTHDSLTTTNYSRNWSIHDQVIMSENTLEPQDGLVGVLRSILKRALIKRKNMYLMASI